MTQKKVVLSLAEQVSELRIRIARLYEERAALSQQKRSRSEVYQLLVATVREYREEATKRVAADVVELADGGAFVKSLYAKVTEGTRLTAPNAMLGPVLVLLLGEESVLSALRPFVDAIPDGLDKAAREARLVAIDDELDALESEEEALIERSEEEGAPLMRRADALPEIVLGMHDEPTYTPSPHHQDNGSRQTRRRVVAASPYIGSSRP